ncbi:hypothetical protein CONPUDRAFT_148401 [Coniophora puteana RWD-64-598 SS2]|uniref:Uncharacterized protein n=1 Tax=Coniophora puteana (strain RWD-64-598) TaxID=741705 RepID=A0A5M3N4G1_CONPW|nr:uncharacterized protein CONPUDRAFT_148401 [Coniophora puteana RWD-64-598 SS2]EIW86309.1 hypothetical protein CONPUDRAFT_148401 [Coniophora puteana RWD-64-598 SS2]
MTEQQRELERRNLELLREMGGSDEEDKLKQQFSAADVFDGTQELPVSHAGGELEMLMSAYGYTRKPKDTQSR